MATIALPAAMVRSKFWRVRFLSYSTAVWEDEERQGEIKCYSRAYRTASTGQRTAQQQSVRSFSDDTSWILDLYISGNRVKLVTVWSLIKNSTVTRAGFRGFLDCENWWNFFFRPQIVRHVAKCMSVIGKKMHIDIYHAGFDIRRLARYQIRPLGHLCLFHRQWWISFFSIKQGQGKRHQQSYSYPHNSWASSVTDEKRTSHLLPTSLLSYQILPRHSINYDVKV